jgi:hypothetical protein
MKSSVEYCPVQIYVGVVHLDEASAERHEAKIFKHKTNGDIFMSSG